MSRKTVINLKTLRRIIPQTSYEIYRFARSARPTSLIAFARDPSIDDEGRTHGSVKRPLSADFSREDAGGEVCFFNAGPCMAGVGRGGAFERDLEPARANSAWRRIFRKSFDGIFL
jgi:hypothetical protein